MQLQQGSQIAKFHLFRKCGLLALNLASIFEKLLDQKTFILLRFVTENTALRKATRIRFGKAGAHPQLVESYTNSLFFLEKTVFPVRQKGVPPLLLPSSVLQLPRCLTRTYNLDFHDLTLLELDSFQKCNCSRKNRLQNLICFANVGCSPTPRQHF